jgi:signal transduction histidine kinase
MQSDTDYLEITFNTIDEGITIYDDQLRLVMWNEQYSRMEITPAKELYRGASLLDTYIGMARAGVFGEGDPQELADTHINALKSGPLIESEQLYGPSNRWIRINRFRLKNGGICATFRDITEERQTEALLRQSAKLKAMGNLTGGLAHDLNNFLTVIMGNLEIAQNDPSSARERINTALAAADSGAHLIKSLLSFARQQPLAPLVINVREPLNILHGMLSKLIGESVTVKLECETDLWLTEIDVNQFESAVLNFLLNSRDAMPDGGELSIEVTNAEVDEGQAKLLDIEPGQYVRVSTSDTGVGMSASTVEQAFDPFFTTKPTKVGNGLGLSMAHGFARQSLGYITISSVIGSGTTVDLYLPRSHWSSNNPSTQQSDFNEPNTLCQDIPMMSPVITES